MQRPLLWFDDERLDQQVPNITVPSVMTGYVTCFTDMCTNTPTKQIRQ